MTLRPIRPVAAIAVPPLAALAVVLATLGACAAAAAPMGPASERFDPVTFFTGTTRGTGHLKQVFSLARSIAVTGEGAVRGDGVMVLDETVAIAGRKTRTRQWQLRETAPGQFLGTLTDARGPVSAQVAGNVLHISYTMAQGGMAVEQDITLLPGGQSAHNVMTIRKLGVTVATLDETISRH